MELTDFELAVAESNIPILVQIFDWARIPESFHKNILNNYEILKQPNEKIKNQTSVKYSNLSRTCIKNLLKIVKDIFIEQLVQTLSNLQKIRRSNGKITDFCKKRTSLQNFFISNPCMYFKNEIDKNGYQTNLLSYFCRKD